MKLAVVLFGILTGLLIWAGGFYLLFALHLSEFERALVSAIMLILFGSHLVLVINVLRLTEKIEALEKFTQIDARRQHTDAKVRA